tara:strand:+ start:1029 stop:2321 length:1293 start_codon:yes stop_codon:yes gene_type:complete
MADTKNIETKVEKVDVDLSEIFNGAPGADSVALPEEETKKTNIFSRKKDVDVSFIDKPKAESKEETTTEESTDDNSETTEEIKQETKKEVVSKEKIDEILGDNIPEETEEVEEPKKTRGRKPIEGVGDVFKKLIDDEKLLAFDDGKEIEDYTAKDWQELIQANLDERANAVRRETPKQFFDSLPQELQIAARYVADGGTDLKGMFGALAQVEEHRALDVKKENDQEQIIREYLGATGFGNAEEIQEEIEVWKDLGKLEQQAMKFKPKLDKMQEKVVAQKLKQQDMVRKQKEQASKNYMQNVYNSLKDGRVGNIKVDKKTQSFIYNGLVNPAYPSISGQNTNLLGHLLEKYQFVEPNYPLVTEALWLLADPKGYKNNIMKLGANKAVEQTVRKLKTAQSSKKSAGAIQEEQPKKRPSRKLPRKSNNIFKRI